MPAEAANLEDLSLLRRAGEGDREAFDRLVVNHQSEVVRLARALTSSPTLAEDVLQETFLAAWRHARDFRGDSAVRTWLFTIARNKAARALRLRAGEPADKVGLQELGAEAGWGEKPSPEQAAAASEQRRILYRALESLPEMERTVIVLRDLEGLSGPVAAEVLGLPLATLKTRLHRARLRLMAALRRGGSHGA